MFYRIPRYSVQRNIHILPIWLTNAQNSVNNNIMCDGAKICSVVIYNANINPAHTFFLLID